MELKSAAFFHQPFLYTPMFYKSSKVARPLENEPPFSALLCLESCAIKLIFQTGERPSQRSVSFSNSLEPNAARDIVPCRHA